MTAQEHISRILSRNQGQAMTTITIERAVLLRALEALRPATAPNGAKRDAAFEELRVALSAPATAPDEQIRKDAERYRWCVDNNLVLAGGTREFGWQIAPVGSEWNRYIDSAMKETP